jgi:hypothetical protein
VSALEALDVLTPLLGGADLPWWRWWRRHVHRRNDAAGPHLAPVPYPPELGPGAAAGGPGVTPSASGPVPGLAVTSERESGPWISCVSCSGVIVLERAGRETSPNLDDAHRIRQGAGLPHSGGMTTDDLVDGVRAAYGGLTLSRVARSKSAIQTFLRAGGALTVFHVYGKLPSNYRRWDTGFTGNHCAAIAAISTSGESVGWYDPLATAGYVGEWIELDVLLGATFDDLYGLPRGEPMGALFSIEAEVIGSVTITESGHAYITVADNVHHPIGDASLPWTHDVFAEISYRAPGQSAGVPAYLIGDDAAVILAKDGTYTPNPAPEPMPPGDYQEGYAAGAVAQWDEWATSLGIPERPAP